MKRLIVTADDFGLSLEVNEAVEEAHRAGILTSASLMVGAPAAEDAVGRAHRLPNLRVGLHLTLVESFPALPPHAIPDLAAADGRLRSDMAGLALALALRAGVRRQLEAEVEAQFDAYALSRLPLDHVDAHKHFHLTPVVSGIVLRVGLRHGIRMLRVPREPAEVLRRVESGSRPGHVAERFLANRLAAKARRTGVGFSDHVFGLAWSGAMTTARLAGLIDALPDGTAEIFMHPATADGFPGAAPGYRYREELAALTSPEVRQAVARAGVLGSESISK